MGTFRVTVTAVGGHGCNRDQVGKGLTGCGADSCPDCITREYVKKLGAVASVSEAVITHWPGSQGQVLDDLLNGERLGGFRAR